MVSRCQQLKRLWKKGAPRRARSLQRWPNQRLYHSQGVDQRTHFQPHYRTADSDLRSILAMDRSTVVYSSTTRGSCKSTCPETTLILQILCSPSCEQGCFKAFSHLLINPYSIDIARLDKYGMVGCIAVKLIARSSYVVLK